MDNFQKQFLRDGYVIAHSNELRVKIMELKSIFESKFHSRFGIDPAINRNLIKRFADSLELASLFASFELQRLVELMGVKTPVYCGPIVSHYTHTDLTGNSYGLPWHQDFPSMASSSNAVIVWISVNACSPQTHSLEVAPRAHIQGLLPGDQKENGYILNEQDFQSTKILEIVAGDVLFFSPFLPHRTFMNPLSTEYKLSFSRRFDDLDCPHWAEKKFVNAYVNSVNRNLYTQT